MKRTISIVLLLVCVLASSAQIQRKFFGFTLGETSKTDIEAYFISNRIRYTDTYGTNGFYVRGLEYAGYKWDVIFGFANDKFIGISFSRFYDNGDSYPDYKKLNAYLNERYGEYLILDHSKNIAFSDDITTVSLKYDNDMSKKTGPFLSFSFWLADTEVFETMPHIQRKHFGFILGKTTKLQAYKHIKKNNYNYSQDKYLEFDCFKIHNSKFAGHIWNDIVVAFLNDTLVAITFSDYTSDIDMLHSTYNQFKASLDKKYSHFLVSHDPYFAHYTDKFIELYLYCRYEDEIKKNILTLAYYYMPVIRDYYKKSELELDL